MTKTPANGKARPRHPDAKLLEALSDHYDSDVALQKALGMRTENGSQVVNNWKRRGIAPAFRAAFARLMRKHGQTPPREWERCPLCGQSGFLKQKQKRSTNHGRESASA